MAELSGDRGNLAQEDVTAHELSIEDDFASFARSDANDVLPFYETETRLLSLWDQLNELQLEIALLNDQMERGNDAAKEGAVTIAEHELRDAEKELLTARTRYMLRQSTIEDTLIAAPILNAVHAGSNATGTEQTLMHLLHRRDILEIAATNLISMLQSARTESALVQSKYIQVMTASRQAAATAAELTRKLKEEDDKVVDDSHLGGALQRARREADTAKEQRNIMKHVISAIVAGSGVDWSRDAALRELVLDQSDEE